MEIVIAILLELILVALVTGNKESSRSVGKVIRIGSFLLLIGLSCLIFIGNLFFYYFSYSEQSLWSTIGLGLAILLPLLLLWINKTYIKELFEKHNKTIFKTLAYVLLWVVVWTTVSVIYQEQKKDIPHLGWRLLIIGFVLSGLSLISRALEKGWRIAFTLDERSPWDKVQDKYEKIREGQMDQWTEFEKNWLGDKESYEFESLLDEHSDKINKIYEERDRELEQVRGLKTKNDWLLVFFYSTLIGIFFSLMGYVWDYVLALVMEFEFIKGRVWLAGVIIVGIPLVLIGLIMSIYEEHFKK